MTLSAAGDRFVVFVGQSGTSAQAATLPLKLLGLSAQDRYNIKLINTADMPFARAGDADHPLAKPVGMSASGAALMQVGLHLPVAFPATLWVLEGGRLIDPKDELERP